MSNLQEHEEINLHIKKSTAWTILKAVVLVPLWWYLASGFTCGQKDFLFCTTIECAFQPWQWWMLPAGLVFIATEIALFVGVCYLICRGGKND